MPPSLRSLAQPPITQRRSSAGQQRPTSPLLPLVAALALCGAVSSAWAQMPPPVVSPGQMPAYRLDQAYPIYPRISINGAPQEKTTGFFAVGDTLYTTRAALAELGITLTDNECQAKGFDASSVPALPAGYFPLDACPLVQHRYASSNQQLQLQVPIARLHLPTTRVGAGPAGTPTLSRPDFSALLNYDGNLAGTQGAGTSRGLLTQWRLGTPWGYFETNHAQSSSQGLSTHQRMDSFWRSVWPDQGITLTLGDTYSSQLANSSGARMGGVQIASSYNTRPWYQKLPQSLFAGSTEMPTSVDLYLNGIKQYSQNVAAGPYELTLPPTVSGNGNAQVITRDALGRQTVVDVPLYDTADLLAPGLNEWSVEAGKLRLMPGAASQYDSDTLISGTWRRGLTNRITLQVHGESKRDYQQTGLAVRASPGFPTQVGLQVSASRYQGLSGTQYNLFATQQGNNWSLSAGANRSSAQFASLGSTVNTGTPFVGLPSAQRQAYVQAGWSQAALGSFSLSRVWARNSTQPQDVWSLSWNKQLNRKVGLMAAASYDQRNPNLRTVMLGISVALDDGISISSYANEQNGVSSLTAQVQKSASQVGDWGWNVGAQTGQGQGQDSASAGVQHISQYGDGTLQARSIRGGADNWQAGWRGGVVLLGGALAATRTVNDSFAMVSANGAANVPVLVQNQLVGNTNSQGQILIPNLMAYQNNLIALDNANMPANLRIANSKQTVVPYEKSGSAVQFDVQQQSAWLLTLVDAKGKPLPTGASVLNDAGGPLTVVGFDGRVYLEIPQPKAGQTTTLRAISVNAQGKTQECRFSVSSEARSTSSNTPNSPYAQDFGVVVCKP